MLETRKRSRRGAVLRGLTDHQVLQRTTSEHALTTIEVLEPEIDGLEVVDASGRVVASCDYRGTPVELEIPVGGPFHLLTRGSRGETAEAVQNFLVGDLWILAGQSNMEGIGDMSAALESPDPRVHVFDMSRQWRLAQDPLHELWKSPDEVHSGGERIEIRRQQFAEPSPKGAGLGIAFGKEMVLRTGIPIGLIATAHGGTSMAQWDPSLRSAGGDSLYGSLLLSVRAAGNRVRGLLWYQGESDATAETWREFPTALSGLTSELRGDLQSGDLRMYQVQLGRVVAEAGDELHERWSWIRDVQRRYSDHGFDGATTSVDLELDDPIHIGTTGLRRLGRRLARLASGAVESIRLQSARLEMPERRRVRVSFEGVIGPLTPSRHIPGFSIRRGARFVADLYEARVAEDDPSSVDLLLAEPSKPGDLLCYGWGLDPFCNLVDAEDMAVLAFGPVPITEEHGPPLETP